MITSPQSIRPATPQDAGALAALVNFAGEGLPSYLWTKMAMSGEDPWSVGRARARREECNNYRRGRQCFRVSDRLPAVRGTRTDRRNDDAGDVRSVTAIGEPRPRNLVRERPRHLSEMAKQRPWDSIAQTC